MEACVSEILHCFKLIGFEGAVSLASLGVSLAATWIARASLLRAEDSIQQAKQIADRDQRDWRQRKWFDLYLKASEAYDALESFQIRCLDSNYLATGEWKRGINDLVGLFRRVHAMALVFPVNPVVTELCLSTAAFTGLEEVRSKDRLERIFDVLDKLREKALVDTTVLE
jgi:hypothetical protein